MSIDTTNEENKKENTELRNLVIKCLNTQNIKDIQYTINPESLYKRAYLSLNTAHAVRVKLAESPNYTVVLDGDGNLVPELIGYTDMYGYKWTIVDTGVSIRDVIATNKIKNIIGIKLHRFLFDFSKYFSYWYYPFTLPSDDDVKFSHMYNLLIHEFNSQSYKLSSGRNCHFIFNAVSSEFEPIYNTLPLTTSLANSGYYYFNDPVNIYDTITMSITDMDGAQFDMRPYDANGTVELDNDFIFCLELIYLDEE